MTDWANIARFEVKALRGKNCSNKQAIWLCKKAIFYQIAKPQDLFLSPGHLFETKMKVDFWKLQFTCPFNMRFAIKMKFQFQKWKSNYFFGFVDKCLFFVFDDRRRNNIEENEKMKKPWKQQIVKKFVGTACCHWREKWREQQWYSDTTQDGISAIMFFLWTSQEQTSKRKPCFGNSENHSSASANIAVWLFFVWNKKCVNHSACQKVPFATSFSCARVSVQKCLCKSVCAKDCFLHFFVCMFIAQKLVPFCEYVNKPKSKYVFVKNHMSVNSLSVKASAVHQVCLWKHRCGREWRCKSVCNKKSVWKMSVWKGVHM